MANGLSSSTTKLPTEDQILAWIKANPDATDEEIRAYALGTIPRQRLGMEGALGRGVALGRGAFNTLTFGFGDELVGTIEGALRPDRTIGEAIAEEREINRELQERFPRTFLGGQIAGGLIGGAGAARLALSRVGALSNILSRIGSRGLGGAVAASAIGGAAAGGLEGFGQAEGGPVERLPEAAVGAAAGGVIGGALPVVGAGLRAVGNALNIRPRFVNPQEEAARLINESLRADRTTPQQILAEAAENPTVPQAAVDLAGDNARQLAKEAQARSTTARRMVTNLLEQREEAERNRHIARLREVLNPEEKEVERVLEDLADLRSARAAENFAPALDKVVSDAELAAFFREPEVKQAYFNLLHDIETLRRAGMEAPDLPMLYDDEGRLVTVDIPVRAFHFVQQAVNDVINSGIESKTITRERARTLLSVLNKMMDKVEQAVPEYGAARAAYRADSAPMHALRAGSGQQGKKLEARFMQGIPIMGKASVEEVARWLGQKRAAAQQGDEVAAAEIEHYLIGAYRYLRDQLTGQKSLGFLDVPDTRNLIRVLMGGDPRKAQEFIDALRAEQRLRLTKRVKREGTAIEGEEAIPTPALDLALAAAGSASGHNYAALASFRRLLRGERTMNERTANAVIQNLFAGTQSFGDLVAAMRTLQTAAQRETERRLRQAGRHAGVAAGAVGAASTLNEP